MSANNKQKKQIKQNVSQMAADICIELKRQVNEQPFRLRVKIAMRILRGNW
jgi:hypothetical protein